MEDKVKILFLNLPGTEKYLREYFCSKVSKARYYYAPVNLVYMTWWFDKESYDIFFFDAIAENSDRESTMKYIKDIDPQYIYFLASAPSFKEDKPFIQNLKKEVPNALLIGDGDIFRELKEESFVVLPELDAINFNFWSPNIVKYIQWADGQIIENIIYRWKHGLITGKENFRTEFWNAPVPRRDLVAHEKYNHPFAIREKSDIMLTDFWCPFNCSFCPMSNIDWSLRPLDKVIDEIKLLMKYWVRDIFFFDQTFGVNKQRTLELCHKMKELKLSRCCFGRVDVVSEDVIKEMAASGCHTILFGIESVNEDLLKKYNKNTKQDSMVNAMKLCRKYKVRTCGTFIIGLPWDTKESIRETIKFAKKLNLDFASFNIATPRIGTNFRNDMITQWRADPKDLNLESAKQKTSSWQHHEITHNDILKLQSYAIRNFYMDPKYLLRRLIKVRSLIELKNLILEGFYLIFK